MDTRPVWIDTAELPEFPTLDRDLAVDVVVVGGGITGITAAYLLKRAGRTVALLERGRCAGADTGHTTAHVTCVTDLGLVELAKRFGNDTARAVWDAGGAAIDQIVALVRAEEIDCGFHWVPAWLHAPLNGATTKDAASLQAEADLARLLGIRASFVPAVPFFGLPGVKFPKQALFHPRRYLAALLRRIEGGGSHVFEGTAAEEFSDEPMSVKAAGHTIRCDYLVLATHTPLMGRTGLVSSMLFQTKLALYTSYASSAQLPSGLIPEGSYWDRSDPYHYLRVERGDGHDTAIFGGEDHKTGQETATTQAFARLEERLRSFAPTAIVDHRWSGQVVETSDGLPFIGETAPRQFAATGFAGNGMTFGTLGAMMAVDAALGRDNPWRELFAIDRKSLPGGAWRYLAENKDYPYHLLRDWLAPASRMPLSDLGRGQGRIVHLGGHKVAAHRDADGRLSLCSPVCTHLQCIVAWNDAEQTWDCPCHGSRFKPTGEVISGPAEEALEKLPPPEGAESAG